MREISNKTLAFLLAIAIVVSLGGTFISLSRLNLLKQPITGLAATTGTINLSVTTSTSMVRTRLIDFGSGRINESTTTYVMLHGNNSNYEADNGNGSWNWLSDGLQYFLIENDGNVNLTLNISSNVSAANFIGGGGGVISDPIMEYAIIFELGDSCNGTSTAQYTWTTLPSTSNSTACPLFYYNASSDKINISVRLGVPQDAATGERVARVTFEYYQYTGS